MTQILAEPRQLPDWLLAKFPKRRSVSINRNEPAAIGEVIPDGQRNSTLTSLAGTMRQKGFDADAIEAAILVVNNTRCDPPLSEDEVRKIAGSVGRYPAGSTARRSFEPDNLTSDLKTPPSEVRLSRVNARDLQGRSVNGEIPELERLSCLGELDVSPLIRGWSTMLTAYPKTGKTEFLTRCAEVWSRSGLKVGYYTEEPESVWAVRLSQLSTGFENVSLIYALGAANGEIFNDIKSTKDDVVVIDTLRLLRIRDENDNALINLTLTPFIAACRLQSKTLIMAHHTRKGSGDHGEAAAGGHAFLGIVDVSLELQRDPQAGKRRILRGWGRVMEVPDLLYELQEDGSMKLLGDPKELAFEDVKERVREAVPSGWIKTSEVRDALEDPKPSVDQVGKALTEWAASGAIERDPPMSAGQKRGKTYKWRDPNLTSAGSSSIGGSEVVEPESSLSVVPFVSVPRGIKEAFAAPGPEEWEEGAI